MQLLKKLTPKQEIKRFIKDCNELFKITKTEYLELVDFIKTVSFTTHRYDENGTMCHVNYTLAGHNFTCFGGRIYAENIETNVNRVYDIRTKEGNAMIGLDLMKISDETDAFLRKETVRILKTNIVNIFRPIWIPKKK